MLFISLSARMRSHILLLIPFRALCSSYLKKNEFLEWKECTRDLRDNAADSSVGVFSFTRIALFLDYVTSFHITTVSLIIVLDK